MNAQTHQLSLFILGLALGLERVRSTVSDASTNLKAFLFDFSEHQAWRNTNNLFNFVHRLDLHDMWIESCLRMYQDNSVLEYGLIREQTTRMFWINKKIHQESSFDCSVIRPEFRREAEEIYSRHELSFEKIVRAIYQNQPHLGSEYQVGIIFVDQPE